MVVLEKRDSQPDLLPPAVAADMRGVLHPTCAGRAFTLERFDPPATIADLVERLWSISWNLPAGVVHVQDVVSYPCVDLVFEPGTARVWGARTRRLRRELRGAGRVLGVKFRPGGYRPLSACPPAALINRSMSARRALTASAATSIGCVTRSVHAASNATEQVRIVERWLTSLTLDRSQTCAALSRVVSIALHDGGIRTVAVLAERSGMSTRRLERLVREHIGMTPKAVLSTVRVTSAMSLLDTRQTPIACLATEVGYADQAHLTNDFRARLGTTPARYRER